jgi:flavin-dependent dehydrogenase
MYSEVWGAGNIPSYQRIPFGFGWVLVGDAHQVMDPWSGMGIDHAATHADFLADSLYRWLSQEVSWNSAMNQYRTQARRWSQKAYRRTTTYAPDFRPMTRQALQRRGLAQDVTASSNS